MTVDQGPDMERYQGVTPIEGETLALCAETYFAQSEQTPTRVRLAVGQADTGRRSALAGRRHPDPEHRRGSGARLDRGGLDDRAGALRDDRRGRADRSDDLEREPCCGDCSTKTVCGCSSLKSLTGFCRCSREKIVNMLASFPSGGAGRHGRAGRPNPRHLRILFTGLSNWNRKQSTSVIVGCDPAPGSMRNGASRDSKSGRSAFGLTSLSLEHRLMKFPLARFATAGC